MLLFARLAALLIGVAPAWAWALTLGVLPIHSPRTTVEIYEPLRAHLEQVLREPVRIESAPDYGTMHARMLRGEFDLVVTAMHLGRIAQRDRRFIPLVQFQPDTDAMLISSAERPLLNVGQLRGKRLAVSSRLAIHTMVMLKQLEKSRLSSPRDFRLIEYQTQANVAQALLNGFSDAAIMNTRGLLTFSPELRERLVILQQTANLPGLVILAKPKTSLARVNLLINELLAFAGQPAGLAFLNQEGFTGFRRATNAVMKRADPYVGLSRKTLKQK